MKLTIYLWLPKLQHAEEMLLNEERTNLRTDVKLISPLVKKQSEMFDKIVHYVSDTQVMITIFIFLVIAMPCVWGSPF